MKSPQTTPTHTQLQSAFDFLDGSVRYYVDIDKQSHTTGEGYDSYEHVTSATITSVRIAELASQAIRKVKDPILAYCVERLLYAHELYLPSAWTVDISPYYYGDEVTPKICNASALKEDIASLQNLSDRERIDFILSKEYGFVLPQLSALANVDIVTAKPDQIDFGNTEYRKKVSLRVQNEYRERTLPVGVFMRDGSKYRIIDGYHRTVTALGANKKQLPIVLLY